MTPHIRSSRSNRRALGFLLLASCLLPACEEMKEAVRLSGRIAGEFGYPPEVEVGSRAERNSGRTTHETSLTIAFADEKVYAMPEAELRAFAAAVAAFARRDYQGPRQPNVIIVEARWRRGFLDFSLEKSRQFTFPGADST